MKEHIILLESGGTAEIWLWAPALDMACAERLDMEGGRCGRSIVFRCSSIQRVPF